MEASRTQFAKKLAGVYLDYPRSRRWNFITVRATRKLWQSLWQVHTTVGLHAASWRLLSKPKSGYGLDWETEKRQLDAPGCTGSRSSNRFWHQSHGSPCDSHRVQGPFPRIFRSHCGKWAPQSEGRKASSVISSWKSKFTADEFLAIFFSKAKARWASSGSSDEIESIGGVEGWIGTTSAEHLMAYGQQSIQKLAAAKVIGNLLLATLFKQPHAADTCVPAL